MSGWDSYKHEIELAAERYRNDFEVTWRYFQEDLEKTFGDRKFAKEFEQGRSNTARAIARFWDRVDRLGQALNGNEMAAFRDNLMPTRDAAKKQP